MIDFILNQGLRLIDTIGGRKAPLNYQVQVFGKGRITPLGVASKIAMVRGKKTRCRNVSRKKPRAGPSSTGDWVLVKRALCKIPVLPGPSLPH
jgi:hypothetical protein